MRKLLTAILGLATFVSVAQTPRKELAPTPPMGWMTWNLCGSDISDAMIREMADSMVSKGFVAAGYNYLFIDDGWQGGRDNRNNIIADPQKFPHGIKSLADYLHSRGIKIGIYSDAAQLTCDGYTGSLHFEEQDAATFASWGIDYLKYDYCNAPSETDVASSRYRVMAEALSKSGRDIVLGVCEWGQLKPHTWAHEAGGQLWRTTYDVRDMWRDATGEGGMGILEIINITTPLSRHSDIGNWTDMDMLVVGLDGRGKASNLLGGKGCSHIEYATQMAMWCMLSSPLAMSCDIRDISSSAMSLLLNPELIAINQDALGRVAEMKYKDDGVLVYSRPLADGKHAVAILNSGDYEKKVALKFSDIGLSGNYSVRDAMEQKDRSARADRWRGKLLPHQTAVIVLTPCTK